MILLIKSIDLLDCDEVSFHTLIWLAKFMDVFCCGSLLYFVVLAIKMGFFLFADKQVVLKMKRSCLFQIIKKSQLSVLRLASLSLWVLVALFPGANKVATKVYTKQNSSVLLGKIDFAILHERWGTNVPFQWFQLH